ncbi:unnamed protein product [marine sediment metagenome]|uniref:Uncharacterized protein n=1 Tax=marine sediment metagenome TaxID=412755 RepID=X0V112_9ZZZZ
MADKRLDDLDTGSLDVADKIIIDKSGNTEAEEVLMSALLTFIRAQNQYYTTVTDGTKNDQITHSLASALVAMHVFDNNGAPFQGIEYVIDDSNNITPNFGFTLTGTWKIVILKLKSS